MKKLIILITAIASTIGAEQIKIDKNSFKIAFKDVLVEAKDRKGIAKSLTGFINGIAYGYFDKDGNLVSDSLKIENELSGESSKFELDKNVEARAFISAKDITGDSSEIKVSITYTIEASTTDKKSHVVDLAGTWFQSMGLNSINVTSNPTTFLVVRHERFYKIK